MKVARRQGALQGVVVRAINVAHLIDVGQVGELGKGESSGRRHLVNVASAHQIRAVVAHVCNLEGKIVGDGVLNVQGPVINIRSGEVRVDSENRTRGSGRATEVRGAQVAKDWAGVVVGKTRKSKVADLDRAAARRPVERSSGWNAGETKAVIESQKR